MKGMSGPGFTVILTLLLPCRIKKEDISFFIYMHVSCNHAHSHTKRLKCHIVMNISQDYHCFTSAHIYLPVKDFKYRMSGRGSEKGTVKQ